MLTKTKIKCPCGQETSLVLSDDNKWLYDEEKHGSGVDSELKCFNCQTPLPENQAVKDAKKAAAKTDAQAELDRIERDEIRLAQEKTATQAQLDAEQAAGSDDNIESIKKSLDKHTVSQLKEIAKRKNPPVEIPDNALKPEIVDLIAAAIVKAQQS